MRLHVINLERSPDRLAKFMAVNRLARVTVAKAIDGLTLDIVDLERQGLVSPGLVHPDFYTIGGVGLAMSHVALWNMASTRDEIVTIAEDDAIIHPGFDAIAPEVIATLPDDWDVILWGFNFDLFMCFEMLPGVSSCLAQFDQEKMRAGIEAFQQQTITPCAYPLTWAFGTLCYSVSPRGARALREACIPLRPIIADLPEAARAPPYLKHFRAVGIDNTMCAAYRNLNAYVCFPPLAVSKNETEVSTVRKP